MCRPSLIASTGGCAVFVSSLVRLWCTPFVCDVWLCTWVPSGPHPSHLFGKKEWKGSCMWTEAEVSQQPRKPTQLVGDDVFVLTGLRHLTMHPMLVELCLDLDWLSTAVSTMQARMFFGSRI